VIVVGAVIVVGDGIGMSSVTSSPVKTGVDLLERGESERVMSIERGFLDDVSVGDSRGDVRLDRSVRHLLGLPR